MDLWFKRKRKFTATKLGIEIPVIAYDSPFVLYPPAFIRPFLRNAFDRVLDVIDGKVIFDKKIYKKTFYEVVRYSHFQALIVFQIVIGRVFYKLRRILSLNIYFKIKDDQISSDLKHRIYFYFPSTISCLVYDNHIPLSFMAFQVDGKTLATSFRDFDFAQQVFNKFDMSGLSVLAWTSNYFLGYPVRIELDKENFRLPSLKDLLIITSASVPGFNHGLKLKSFYHNSLKRKYSEESFPENLEAINFSQAEDSEIAKPIVVKKVKKGFQFKIVNQAESVKEMDDEKTINVIYPIALLTKENEKSSEWDMTPQKNISGFLLGYKKGKTVCMSLSSTSFVRMKVNELMPFLNYLCRQDKGMWLS
ncbi:hypothetical protein M1307_01000 [Patescibacteria group bacterium]|nr:hypothetical protein [Patescibacteria group bacterium]